jgi:DNA-binding transcriptional LysR family regulator
MTLDQLRIFVAVAEHGHVTRAAKVLSITQSAASAAIGALEARYNVSLFDRVGRGIALTETGQRFLPEAKAVLGRASAAQMALEDLSGLTTGRLRIAASQTIASYWLPPRLAAYGRLHPGIVLDVTIGNTSQVEQWVLEGAADLGIVEGTPRQRDLTGTIVGHDRMAMVAAPDDPLAGATARITPLSGRWVVREAGSGTRAIFDDWVASHGLPLERIEIALVLPSNEAVREAVEAGAGATIISNHVVAASLRGGSLVALAFDCPPRDFQMLHHPARHVSRAQAAFAELLPSMAQKQAAQ